MHTPSWVIFSSHLCPSLLLSLLVTFIGRVLTPKTQSEAPGGESCLTLRAFTLQPFWNSWWYFAKFPINSCHLLSFPRYCCMERASMAEKKWWQPPVSQCWRNLVACSDMDGRSLTRQGTILASCMDVSGGFKVSLVWCCPYWLVLGCCLGFCRGDTKFWCCE